jgi:hypothetical protein
MRRQVAFDGVEPRDEFEQHLVIATSYMTVDVPFG